MGVLLILVSIVSGLVGLASLAGHASNQAQAVGNAFFGVLFLAVAVVCLIYGARRLWYGGPAPSRGPQPPNPTPWG